MTDPNDSTTIRSDTGKRHRHKYDNRDPLHRLALGRFLDTVGEELKPYTNVKTLDFGCGEARFLAQMKQRGVRFEDLVGIDLRDDALREAGELLPEYRFETADLLTWNQSDASFDLVIASQVLEHLPHPETFLKKLVALTRGTLLLTVPWEPWFRLLNLARGRDIRHLGNHPEHINHFTPKSFREFIEPHARVTKLYTVFPFIIAVARP